MIALNFAFLHLWDPVRFTLEVRRGLIAVYPIGAIGFLLHVQVECCWRLRERKQGKISCGRGFPLRQLALGPRAAARFPPRREPRRG